ncbi:hypothetical protein IDJ75_01995 [Mucilaginibacter rigui]|uniref:TonB-dependent receptor plug domain-containing protein n=1 Tax=Mucilaginibacter rigui TaxID=534635 RepID=A0ABR7X0A3_9SPHI|nr:hypothetical protein [Mucilaginibacter rigui]MBD1384033.1 hypothetical protein [Mucilaginibacter rigui]
MKKLLLILLMLLSVCAFAQTRKKHATKKKAKSTAKHSKKRSSRHRLNAGDARMEEPVEEEERATYPFFRVDSTTKKLVLTDPPDEKDRPFVLVNDNVYNGRLQDLKPQNILDISVVKSKGAKMMYGQKAAAGALIIKTKQALPADLPGTLLPLPKQQGNQKPFMFNEEVTYGKVEDIDPAKILSIDTLIQPKFAGSKDNDTTISVTTKVYGKKLYQWKLGTLSKAYKKYIRGRRGNDAGVDYVLGDGTILTGGKEEDLINLLKVYNSGIKAATFTGPSSTRKSRKRATVTIELDQAQN